jgi:hypothetical protein
MHPDDLKIEEFLKIKREKVKNGIDDGNDWF